jgi:hypothetical protein
LGVSRLEITAQPQIPNGAAVGPIQFNAKNGDGQEQDSSDHRRSGYHAEMLSVT